MILRQLHRWLGLTLCLSLLLMSFTGVMLVWKKEYLWLSFPEARVNVQSQSVDLAKAIQAIERYYSEGQLRVVQLHPEGLALHKALLQGGQAAWHDQDGVQLEQWDENGRFEDWLLDLHHRFLLGNDIGLNIAGFSGLLLIPLLVIGIVLWWPLRRFWNKGLLPSFKTSSKSGSMSKGALIRSHSNLGFLSAIPILLVTITGIFLVYPDQSRELLIDPFLDQSNYEQEEGPLDTLVGADNASWQRVIERSRLRYPNAEIRWVTPVSYFSDYRVVGLQQENGWNRSGQTTIYIEERSGHMDINLDALKKSKLERMFNFAYSLHTGKLDLWYRLLLSVFGLAMFTISLFGLISFFKKR